MNSYGAAWSIETARKGEVNGTLKLKGKRERRKILRSE
jgi:hypothetical protein